MKTSCGFLKNSVVWCSGKKLPSILSDLIVHSAWSYFVALGSVKLGDYVTPIEWSCSVGGQTKIILVPDYPQIKKKKKMIDCV